MKKQHTIQGLAGELQRRLGTMEDAVADTRRMNFHVETTHLADEKTVRFPVLDIDSWNEDGTLGTFAVNDYASGQIAQRLQIPRRFYDRMVEKHPDIVEDTVNKLFRREPEVRMIRTLDDEVRAFLSNSYRRLDNWDLMDKAIVPALADSPGAEVFSAGLTDTRLYLKVIFPELRLEVKPGQEVSPGICISNSEVGAGSLAIEPFTYTWACTNGMLMGLSYANFGMRKYHTGRRIEDNEAARALFSASTLQLDDEAFFATVHDVVKGAKDGILFEAAVNQMRDLAGITVEGDPVQAVERLAKTHTLNETEQASVMRHLIEGGDLSAWGYVSAVTRTAEDVASYDRATELERLGGVLLDAPAKSWQTLAAATS